MNPEMSFDDAVSKAINSGLLSQDEITVLQSSLKEMRVLAYKQPFTKSDGKKMAELRNAFDDLAVKGMPEFEHLRPKPKTFFSRTLPFIIGISIAAIYLWFKANYA